MKLIKLALISLVFLGLLVTGISLLLPSSIHISRAIDIRAPYDSVFTRVSHIANWPGWYAGGDTTASVSLRENAGHTSLFVNKTAITINAAADSVVKAVWQYEDNEPLPGEFHFIAHDSAGLVTVQWQFTQKVKWYPWQKFALIVAGRTIGPAMEKSLENLRNAVELSK